MNEIRCAKRNNVKCETPTVCRLYCRYKNDIVHTNREKAKVDINNKMKEMLPDLEPPTYYV